MAPSTSRSDRRSRSRSPPPTHSNRSEARGGASTSHSNYRQRSRSRSRSPIARRRDHESRSRRRDDDDDDRHRRRGGDGGRGNNSNNKMSENDGSRGGDGGWGGKQGSRDRSPGRPSLSLPSQASLTRSSDERGGGGDKPVTQVAVIEPNFKPSGALAAETNTFQGVVLKYNEPPEARKPVRNWRLYVFKGKEQVELFHVHQQSAYLIGRDRIVADIPIDHPSTSKQHAVLQYRQAMERNEFGDSKTMTKPFIIDLDSANGTLVNDEKIPASRYYELKTGDVLKFAFSTREYVLLAET